jgi:hypothetical protein
MPQLNTDGLRSFSANDWLAPAITFVFLGVYRNLHPPADQTDTFEHKHLRRSSPLSSTS